jgi:hypothetical protein
MSFAKSLVRPMHGPGGSLPSLASRASQASRVIDCAAQQEDFGPGPFYAAGVLQNGNFCRLRKPNFRHAVAIQPVGRGSSGLH